MRLTRVQRVIWKTGTAAVQGGKASTQRDPKVLRGADATLTGPT
jgi:hypothetical protein